MKFTILGPGAVGSILAAHLIRAGHPVTLIARGKRAEYLRAHGLTIHGLADFTVPATVIEDPADLHSVGALVIATKTPGTAATLATLAHVKPDAVLSIQNGIQKNELLAHVFGRDKTLGALADFSGELTGNGEVLFTRNVNLTLGELGGGLSDRATQIATAIDASGVRASAVPDIVTLEWSKFVAWAGLMLLAVTTRAESWKYLHDPDTALLLVRMIREMNEVAQGEGITVTDRSMLPVASILASGDVEALKLIHKAALDYRERAPQHRMSALQDLLAHRPLEVNDTIGYALQLAKSHHIPMPLTENLYALVCAMDRIERNV